MSLFGSGQVLTSSSVRKEIIFIATRGLIPVIVQSASYALFPSHKWPAWAAYPFYFLCLASFAMRTVRLLPRSSSLD